MAMCLFWHGPSGEELECSGALEGLHMGTKWKTLVPRGVLGTHASQTHPNGKGFNVTALAPTTSQVQGGGVRGRHSRWEERQGEDSFQTLLKRKWECNMTRERPPHSVSQAHAPQLWGLWCWEPMATKRICDTYWIFCCTIFKPKWKPLRSFAGLTEGN